MSRRDEILTMPNPFADKHPHKEGTQEDIGSAFLSFVRSSNCSSCTGCLTSSSISIFFCVCACSNGRCLSPLLQSKYIRAVCHASLPSCVPGNLTLTGMHLQGCRARKPHWNITFKICFLPKELRRWGRGGRGVVSVDKPSKHKGCSLVAAVLCRYQPSQGE